MKIILASTSPRRRELFHLVTDDFEVIPSFAEEVSDEVCGEKLVYFLAKLKADSVFATHSESVVVGCDTVVVLD
ncbi:MAG: Maf family protein, partial [Clostridia bacterium]